MSTIQDLNTARTITYNDEASYAIVFGANAGNVTANVDAYTTANITQRTTLTSITSPVRDLLLDVQFSNVGNVSMAYAGTYSNISLLQVAPAAWRVNGIRSVSQYTEAFANVKFTDLTGGFATNPDYSYVTTVNDQAGNTRAWTTTLNVIAQPTLSITGNVIYNEDTMTNVTVANVLVDGGSVVIFRLYANTIPTYGAMSNGVVTGNSIFIDGNATSLNSQITAGGLKFLPASDYVSNVANAINFSLGNTTTVFSTANANIQIGTQDTDYSLTTSYNYTEDDTKQMVFAITDQDTHANITYVSTFAQTSGPTSQFYVNGVAQGYGNSAVLANTKANINSANVSFLPYPDSTANIGLTYSQVKILPTGNTTQASNIAITMVNTVSHDDYSLTTSYDYTEDETKQLVFAITDTDIRAQSYTSTFTQTSGNTSQFYVNGVAQGYGNPAVVTGNITTVNAANVSFLPYPDSTANIGLTYSQTKLNVFGNTNIQANALPITMTNTVSHNDYSFAAGTYDEDTITTFGNTITDTDVRAQSYTITLQQTAGNAGVFYRSNVAVAGNANTLISISNSKANINSTVSWLPPVDYTGNVTFTYNQSKLNVFGNTNTQASNVTAVFSVTNTNPEISNMTARTITANAVANIFATTTPYINDGPDYGQSYTITLSSPVGKFGTNTANALLQNTFTSTGNTTTINNLFGNIVFVNNYGVPAQTSSFTYTQSRDSISQVNTSPVLTISAGSIANTYTRVITSNSTFTPTAVQVLFGNIQILTVGGGGGGAGGAGGLSNDTIKGTGGGGGAGGQAQLINATQDTANALQDVTYSVVVGGGGGGNIANANVVTASSGSPSYLQYGGTTLFYSAGGTGGVADATTPTSSDGGNNGVYAGGSGGQAFSGGQGNARVGGGGAGAGAVGSNADLGSLPAVGGDGGIGFAAADSGSTFGTYRYYGGGGGGGRNGQGASSTGGGGDGNAQPGTNGRGGGGGGSTWFYKAGGNGNGGSGTIVIKIS